MSARRWFTSFALLLASAPGSPVHALIPGGRVRASDCLAEWRVGGRSVASSRGTRTLDCQDGDPSCDADGTVNGSCTMNVSVCTLQHDPSIPECVAPGALT